MWSEPLQETWWGAEVPEARGYSIDFHHSDAAVKALCSVVATFCDARFARFKHRIGTDKTQRYFLTLRGWSEDIRIGIKLRIIGRRVLITISRLDALPERDLPTRQSRRCGRDRRWSRPLGWCWRVSRAGISRRALHCGSARWARSGDLLLSRTPSAGRATASARTGRTTNDKKGVVKCLPRWFAASHSVTSEFHWVDLEIFADSPIASLDCSWLAIACKCRASARNPSPSTRSPPVPVLGAAAEYMTVEFSSRPFHRIIFCDNLTWLGASRFDRRLIKW